MNNIENKLPLPAKWFAEKFPRVAEKYGAAVLQESQNEKFTVKALREDFFAAALGELGHPNTPTVYLRIESRFYTYRPDKGIYVAESEDSLIARLSAVLAQCAKACNGQFCNTETLEFRLSQTSSLRGVIQRAKGVLEVSGDFFENSKQDYIPCANGMLRLEDKQLLPYSPTFHRRNKLAVKYDSAATCPMFIEVLLKQALDDADIELLQKWCGLVLVGTNLSQVILLLVGTSGGGKGTITRVIVGIVGEDNVVELRTNELGGRFETASFLGKTLLYGADVKAGFLNNSSASYLKSLTGGDLLSVEIKGQTDRPRISGNFNIFATSNSRLTVNLESDKDAWMRRLIIIPFCKPKPEKVVVNLSEQILEKESSGVLNWMLEGLDKIKRTGFVMELTQKQRKTVENLLLESDSPRVFATEKLIADEAAQLLACDCYTAYATYCKERSWTPIPSREAAGKIAAVISGEFGLSQRNDLLDSNGRANRGWKGVKVC